MPGYKSYDEGDEDLATLARAAGYFPNNDVEGPGDPTPEEPENPMPPPVPEERMNPSAFAAAVDPSFNMGSVAPVGSSYLPPGTAPGALPAGTSHSQSTAESQSYHGFNSGKFGEVQRTTTPGLAGDWARSDEQAMVNGSRETPLIDAAYNSSVDAAHAEANAQVNAVKAQGDNALVMQRLNDEFAVEEQKINAQALAQSNQAKADYMAALADFRAAKVDPSQLWHNMTGGERFGTLAAAFVHDFLGVKGINTSAMTTLNKAIDRNIDAQVQAIRTKGEVAEGFKSLWYMQRNQSASDAEARARVRTFLLDGAKQAAIAYMAPYQSALASAQGKAAVAKIDEELAKSYIDVYRHIDSNALALRQQALSKWQTQVQAALETQANAIRQQEANTHAREVDSKTKGQIPRGIYDPESGHLVAFYKPGITEPEMRETDAILKNTKDAGDDIEELRRLTRALGNGNVDPITGTKFAGTEQQMFDSLATRLAHSMVKSLGERATDKDVDQMLKGLRTPSWLNRANAERVIAFTEDRVLNPARNQVAQYGYVPNPDGTIMNAPTNIIFKGTTADARATHTPPPKTPEEIRLEKAAMDSGNTKRAKEILEGEDLTAPVKQLHEQLVKERPDLFTKTTYPNGPLDEKGGVTTPVPPRRWEHSLTEYADLAEKGDKNALAYIQRLAAGYTLNHDDPEAAAAAFLLTQLPVTQPGQ